LGILTSFFLKGSLFRVQSKDFSGKAINRPGMP